MDQVIIQSPVKQKFLDTLEGNGSALERFFPQYVESAQRALEELEFPTTRVEDWKYTRTTRISNERWRIQPYHEQIDISPFLIPGLDAFLVVFVNGFFREDLSGTSTIEGVMAGRTPHSATSPETRFRNIFEALNAVYCTDVFFIETTKNAVISKPIHILHITSGETVLSQPYISIDAASGSELHIVESFISLKGTNSFSNRALEIFVDENAGVTHNKIQMETDECFQLNHDHIVVRDNGRFTINTLTIDGGWVRNGLDIDLSGKNIETHLNGFYMPRRRQLVDNHTRVDHQYPYCNSNELYKGILNDQGIGVFNGKVYVRPDAQKTNAYQSNANILLSDDAQINTKPELEIYADDVKCSHGTTTGQMDENALFYLKSRGLGEASARKLLSTAFISDVLTKVEHIPVREYVISELQKRELLFA